MSKAEDLEFGRKKKYSRQSPTVFAHIKYEGVWTHDAWVRHKDAVRERLEALRALSQWRGTVAEKRDRAPARTGRGARDAFE